MLNVKFTRDMFASEAQLDRLVSLFQTYFQMGGLQLQVNVVDQETLRAAQRAPEQYADLVVRVGGFSEYFLRAAARAAGRHHCPYRSLAQLPVRA